MKGKGVFLQALANVAQQLGKPELVAERDRLFGLYDVVTGDVDKSSAAEIRARAYDPDTAAALANEIVKVYDDIRQKGATDSIQKASSYLDRQTEASAKDLKTAEQQLQAYRATLPSPDLVASVQARAPTFSSFRAMSISRSGPCFFKSGGQGDEASLDTSLL